MGFDIEATSIRPAVGYMEIVERRDTDTVIPIIMAVVEPGSVVRSDDRRACNSMSQAGLSHRTVNHTVNFVEPSTGVHTHHAESLWNQKNSDKK